MRSRKNLRRLQAMMLSLGLTTGIAPAFSSGADVKQITTAIDRGLAYLRTRQNHGNWETVQKPIKPGDDFDMNSGQYTGRTALVVWTLLAGGVSAQDPAVVDAVKFLEANPTDGVYALGVRTQVWSMLGDNAGAKAGLQRDAAEILDGSKTHNELATGFYHYLAKNDPANQDYDHSVSQFGVLGLWAGGQAGVTAPRKYWEMTALSWMSHQYPDGGWTYKMATDGPATGTASMTAAGVATLFIAQDELAGVGQRGSGDLSSLAGFGGPDVSKVNAKRLKSLWQNQASVQQQPNSDAVQVSIDAGMKWVGDHYDLVTSNDHQYYTLFGISRIGAASGRKFIGTTDWYKQGADYILSKQNADGSFRERDEVTDTCLALLFLERGLAPVMINKLQYARGETPSKTNADPAHWNNRTRDANNLTRWFGHSTEKFFNWQTVSLDNGVDELHDSPILYISGDQPLNFSASDEDKLRLFVEQGGLILGNADDARESFASSFRKLGTKLFHQYEFRELPANHPIYTAEQFQRSKWKAKPAVLSLSNGVRELMILIPQADPAKAWQAQQTKDHPELHQLAADIYLYVADKDNLRYRMPDYVVQPDPKITGGQPLAVARIFYSGAWDPEPGAWRRIAAVAHNTAGMEVSTETVKLGDASPVESAPRHGKTSEKPNVQLASSKMAVDKDRLESPTFPMLGNQPLAHLTGSVAFSLSPTQRDAIKTYVTSGGTLLIDSAGGATAFKSSAETEMTEIFGTDALQLREPLDLTKLPDSPIVKELLTITVPKLRHGTEAAIGKADGLRLRGIVIGGRLAVIYSPLDLTEGMVGQPVDGIVGYTPATAEQIVLAIVKAVGVKR